MSVAVGYEEPNSTTGLNGQTCLHDVMGIGGDALRTSTVADEGSIWRSGAGSAILLADITCRRVESQERNDTS